eukprot:7282885-Pyramimonas_sp.AAC.1
MMTSLKTIARQARPRVRRPPRRGEACLGRRHSITRPQISVIVERKDLICNASTILSLTLSRPSMNPSNFPTIGNSPTLMPLSPDLSQRTRP